MPYTTPDRPRRLAATALLALLGAALPVPAQGPDSAGQGLEAMAALMPIAPWGFYPDDQVLSDFSGTVTITLTASGGASLPPDQDGGRERVSADLALEFVFRTVAGREQTAVMARGHRVETYHRPARGHDPGRRERTVTRFSGPSQTTPLRIANLHYSRKLGLSSFQVQIGTQQDGRSQVNHLGVTESRQVDDQAPERMAWDDHAWFLSPPCGGTSNSRWAQLMRSGNASAMPWAGPFYYESASAHGESQGSLAVPVLFRDLQWASPRQWAQTGHDPAARPEAARDVFFAGELQIRWSFVTRAVPGKMVIEPDRPRLYEEWLPTPMPDRDTDGPVVPLVKPDEPDAVPTVYGPATPLLVTARIEPAEPGGTAPKGRIHFYLRDVSRHPGECGGHPPEGGTEPDLRFVDSLPGIIVDPADPLHAYTEQDVERITVAIEARDTGAYGVVQAVCDDLGLMARDPRTGRSGLAVPLDDNQNCVADAWERAMELRDGLPEDDDDGDGDGCTLFDEYRGLMTPQGFRRTDPRSPDR